jgi:quercetin 2,3-dioxygenase
MKKIFHSSESRGSANHGWLKATHSFSFANYYDNNRIHFGKLRVLNDDIISPTKGFDIHPHQDMEIITIPLSGSLKHGDNMGHEEIIKAGEVQVMSAGTGVWHSEFNASGTEELNLFQIWIFPDKKGRKPRYEQKLFLSEKRQGNWQLLVSPDGRDESLWIHQDAFISLIESGEAIVNYTLNTPNNGVYFMLVEGEALISGEKLSKRDALGVWEIDGFVEIKFNGLSKLLTIEVPMD